MEIPRPSDAPYPLYGIHEPYRYDEIEEWGDRVWMPDEEAPVGRTVYLTAPDKPGLWTCWRRGARSLATVAEAELRVSCWGKDSLYAFVGPRPPDPQPVCADGWYWVRWCAAPDWIPGNITNGRILTVNGRQCPISEHQIGRPIKGCPDE